MPKHTNLKKKKLFHLEDSFEYYHFNAYYKRLSNQQNISELNNVLNRFFDLQVRLFSFSFNANLRKYCTAEYLKQNNFKAIG